MQQAFYFSLDFLEFSLLFLSLDVWALDSDQSNHFKNVEMNLNENFAIFSMFFVLFVLYEVKMMKANESRKKKLEQKRWRKVSENSIFNWTACCSLNENNEHGKNSSGIKSALRFCQQFSHYHQPENGAIAAATQCIQHTIRTLNSQAQLRSNHTAWLPTTETFIVHIIQSKSMVYKPSDHLTLIHCFRVFLSFCFHLCNLLLYFVSYVYDVMPFHLNYFKLFFVCLFLCCTSNYFEFVMRFLPRYYYSLNVLKFVWCLFICAMHIAHTPHTSTALL